MSNKEILEKAIQKAIDGGWNNSLEGYGDDILLYAIMGQIGESYIAPPLEEIIFNHDFAKALWGEGHYNLIVGNGTKAFGCKDVLNFVTGQPVLEAWQYHLQQMVIAPDPIAYLGENI